MSSFFIQILYIFLFELEEHSGSQTQVSLINLRFIRAFICYLLFNFKFTLNYIQVSNTLHLLLNFATKIPFTEEGSVSN